MPRYFVMNIPTHTHTHTSFPARRRCPPPLGGWVGGGQLSELPAALPTLGCPLRV